jgi:hypothetical protein
MSMIVALSDIERLSKGTYNSTLTHHRMRVLTCHSTTAVQQTTAMLLSFSRKHDDALVMCYLLLCYDLQPAQAVSNWCWDVLDADVL